MNKRCTCTYWELKLRGLKPIDHASECPCRKGEIRTPEISPFKEVWRTEEDYIRYNQLNEKRKEVWEKTYPKIKSKTTTKTKKRS